MMTNSATQLAKVNEQIAKLKKQFTNRKGQLTVNVFEGFTIDISFGGNKHVDVGRVCIGSISNDESSGKEFLNFVLEQLEGSRKFWIDACERDKKELETILVETRAEQENNNNLKS